MTEGPPDEAESSVTLLTVEGPASRVLANVLNSAGLLHQIVLESDTTVNRFRTRARHLLRYLAGLARVRPPIQLRPPLEQRIESVLLDASQRRVTEQYPASFGKWPRGVPRIVVGNLNGVHCQDLLKKHHPDVIAVFRTRIIHSSIFSLARLGAVNCHFSLLPEYRGSFVEFWQILNNDLHTAGVTFHFLDKGVDRGDIIASVAHEGLPRDITPFDLRYRNYLLMLEHFPEVLKTVLNGQCDRRPQRDPPSRAYRYGDITDKRRRELYRRLGLL